MFTGRGALNTTLWKFKVAYNIMGALHQEAFLYTLFGLHIVYVAILFGVIEHEPVHIRNIDFWAKVYTSVFLLWRFNPISPAKFTDFDRNVVFSAGVFMFTSTIVTEYVSKAKKLARKVGRSVLDKIPSSV